MKFPVFLKHAAQNLFYFPKNVIYFLILYFFVQYIYMTYTMW